MLPVPPPNAPASTLDNFMASLQSGNWGGARTGGRPTPPAPSAAGAAGAAAPTTTAAPQAAAPDAGAGTLPAQPTRSPPPSPPASPTSPHARHRREPDSAAALRALGLTPPVYNPSGAPPRPLRPPRPARPSLQRQNATAAPLQPAPPRPSATRSASPPAAASIPPPSPRATLQPIVDRVRATLRQPLVDALRPPEAWLADAQVVQVVTLRHALVQARQALPERRALVDLIGRLDDTLVALMTLWPRGCHFEVRHQALAHRGLHHVLLGLAADVAAAQQDGTLPATPSQADAPPVPLTAAATLLARNLAAALLNVGAVLRDPLALALVEASIVLAANAVQLLARLDVLVAEGGELLQPYSQGGVVLSAQAAAQAAPWLRQLQPLARRLSAETTTLQHWLRLRLEASASLRAETLVRASAHPGRLPSTLPCPVFPRRTLPITCRYDVQRVLAFQLTVIDVTEGLLGAALRTGEAIRAATVALPR